MTAIHLKYPAAAHILFYFYITLMIMITHRVEDIIVW